MSEPFIKEAGNGMSLVGKTIIGVMVFLTAAGLGMVFYQFNSFRNSAGVPYSQTFSQVAISNPPHGLQLEAGDSIIVETAAIGSVAFVRMELWINGALLGVQTAPEEGSHPFSPYFSWRPIEPGFYSLVAVALDVNGLKTISDQVVVIVIPSEVRVASAALDSPPVFPVPAGGDINPPSEPASDAGIGPADGWSVSIGDWLASSSLIAPPTPPELYVRPGDCRARLYIHDLSDDEEGFVVYRQAGDSNQWNAVVVLDSQTAYEWITYQDEESFGGVSYFVTAFNSQGEAASNIAFINIDPTGCASGSSRASTLTMALALQLQDLSADLVYCYFSTNGVNWSRWPHSGFLSNRGDTIQSEILALNLVGNGAGENSSLPLSLFLDCWGWQGGMLHYLGTVAEEGISPQPGSMIILGDGLNAELVMEAVVLPGQTDLFLVGSEFSPNMDYLLNLGLVNPVSPEIPRANLFVTTDTEICGNHLPPDAQNLVGQLIYCFPYPAYDLTKGAAEPQPYLVWGFDFEPICEGGVGEPCKSYWELLNLAEETGGQVGFTIESLLGSNKTVWNVTEPNLTMFVVPPVACLGSIDYSVRLWYRSGNQQVEAAASPEQNMSEVGEFEISPQEILFGPYSNWVSIPCNNSNFITPSIVEYYKEIRVNFSDIRFFHLYDGGGDDYVIESDTNVELYGYFRVEAPSFGHWQTEYCFTPWAGNCDLEPYWTGTRRYLLIADWEEDESLNLKHVTSSVLRTAYKDLEYWELCLASTKYSCEFEGQSTSYEIENNSITVIIKEGDTLTIEMRLVDYDEFSGDDDVCVGALMIPTEEFIYGTLNDPYHFQIIGDLTDSGECILSGSIEPIRWITPGP